MFTSDHFVHFVLDFYNEIHYTDTLLALSVEAYVWYELRKQHIDNALFVTENGSELKLGAYDSDSGALLKPEKKKFWSKTQSEPEQAAHHVTFTLPEVGEDAQSLLGWLLDRQESQKNRRVALVFTMDAFLTLYKKAKDKDRQRLVKLCSRPAGRSLLLIRVPMNAREMSKAFLDPQSPLQQLCPGVCQAAAGPREPLMDALDRQLDRQILHAYRLTQADMLGILMRHALVKGTWSDSMRDLEDQAACLYGANLSRNRCATRREVYESVQKEGAQEELRIRAAQLRRDYPRLSVAEAMLAEAVDMRGPAPLEWDSELAKNVRTLTLPEEFLQAYPQYQQEMDTIREDFRTVWNKPMNRTACQAADGFCTEVRAAAKRRDWDTLADALGMLKFCGSEICADSANDEGIKTICEEGRAVINQSYNLFLQRQSQEQLAGAKAAGGLYGRKIDAMHKDQQKIAQVSYEASAAQLQMMRNTLRNVVTDFEKRHVSQAVVAQFYQAAQEQVKRQLDNAIQGASYQEPVSQKVKAPAFEDISFDDDAMPLDSSEALDQPPRVYTEQDKEADKKAIEDLFNGVF